MPDPFRMTGRLIFAVLMILGYLMVGICQSLWYASHHRTDQIGDALGETGRAMIDAIAGVFRK